MSIFSRLFKAPVNFVESKVEQAKGEVRKEAANAMASVSMIVVMALLALIVLFFLSAGVALLLNIALESEYLGFIIVGAFYLLLLVVAVILRTNDEFMERLRKRYRKEFGVPDREIDVDWPDVEEYVEDRMN
jgi:uncharacterized membrane protein YqjE